MSTLTYSVSAYFLARLEAQVWMTYDQRYNISKPEEVFALLMLSSQSPDENIQDHIQRYVKHLSQEERKQWMLKGIDLSRKVA